MSGPVHMNQVIFQTPTVEKIQQAELHGQDQAQRHVAIEEQNQQRQKTETVQTLPEPEHARVTENERRESSRKRERRRKKKERRAKKEKAGRKEAARAAQGSGSIVDVVI